MVQDFGTGLPLENWERLSEPDIRFIGVKQKGNFKNSMFGLLIVRLVAERLGWTLELIRSNNEGTAFRIVIGNAGT